MNLGETLYTANVVDIEEPVIAEVAETEESVVVRGSSKAEVSV